MAEYSITYDPFGKGGFREAFQAKSKTPTFQVQQWVVKRYLKPALDIIKDKANNWATHKEGGANADAGLEFYATAGTRIKTGG